MWLCYSNGFASKLCEHECEHMIYAWFVCAWPSTYPSLPIPIFCTKDLRAVCSSLAFCLSFRAANQTIDNDNDILKWLWLWCKCLRIIYKSSIWERQASDTQLTNYDEKKESARKRRGMIIIHVESSKPHLCTANDNCRVQRKKNHTIIIIEPC